MVAVRRSLVAPLGSVLLAGAVVASEATVLAAQGSSEDVPVPGGIAALARVLDIDAPDRARCLSEIVRVVYGDFKYRFNRDSLSLRVRSHLAAAAASVSAAGRARPSDLVPVPLTTAVWSRAVFRRPVTTETLFAEIVSDPYAALLAHGLSALDDETLQFLAERPALLSTLYTRHAIVFASFTAHLRIRGNRVVPPGGDPAVPLWEAVLRAPVTDPAEFVTALYAIAEGRMAYLYDVIGHLDGAGAAFALGLWLPDSTIRVERFQALTKVAASFARPEWDTAKIPFSRPVFDLVALFNRVQVERSGAPRFPSSQRLWTQALSDRGEQRNADQLFAEDARRIDAAWLAESLLSGSAQSRNQRLDHFAFGHRAFVSARDTDTSQLITAISLFPRVPVLMLTLEQIGVRRPATYVALANHAERLVQLDASRAPRALAQFQGAIALVSRLVRVQAIDGTSAERLLNALASVTVVEQRGYVGGIASWLQHDLGPSIASAGALGLDDALARALAGRAGREAIAPLAWEGQIYVFDLAASETQRLLRFNERRVVSSLEKTCRLRDVAASVADGTVSMHMIADALGSLRATLAKLPHTEKAIQQLSMPVRATTETAQALFDVVDTVMADTLSAWAYAIAWSDPDGQARQDHDLHRRHDFGLNGLPARARTPWALPRVVFNAGHPWHVQGALLGLEVPLATLALRRTDSAPPLAEPRMLSTNRYAFVASLGLMNVFALRDDDADAIASAIARGQRRIEALSPQSEAVRAVIDEIAMDGWRARALRWNVVHAPERVPAMFSMTELLHLGNGRHLDVHAWGMSALEALACLCTHVPSPNLHSTFAGRHRIGLLTVAVPDLNLRVAVVLRELRMPAALAKSVLAAALYDLLAAARPAYPDDWLALVRHAKAVSAERIADYLAAATGVEGLLSLAPSAGQQP